MDRKQATATFFLLTLTTIALYFSYLIARPFLTPIFLALMIAIVFHPVHARIDVRIRSRNVAALISTSLVLFVVVLLVVGLGIVVSQEVRDLYHLLDQRTAAQGGLESLRDAHTGTASDMGWTIRRYLRSEYPCLFTALA